MAVTYASAADLAGALRSASAAHGRHEQEIGQAGAAGQAGTGAGA